MCPPLVQIGLTSSSCRRYICQFSDLQIRSVLLDEIMRDPDNPTREHITELETKSLRDSRDLLDKVLFVI